jgi:hypothetical protein
MQHSPELIKQAASAKAVRDRLFNPKNTLKRSDLEQEREAVANLKSKVAELASELAARDKRIWKLELDVADRNARLLAQADLIGTLDNAGVFVRSGKKPVAAIVAEVLKDFPDVTWDDIVGVRRMKCLVKPRHLCVVAVYEQRTDLSLPAIGKIFRRDHTSILASVRKLGATRSAA